MHDEIGYMSHSIDQEPAEYSRSLKSQEEESKSKLSSDL